MVTLVEQRLGGLEDPYMNSIQKNEIDSDLMLLHMLTHIYSILVFHHLNTIPPQILTNCIIHSKDINLTFKLYCIHSLSQYIPAAKRYISLYLKRMICDTISYLVETIPINKLVLLMLKQHLIY